MKELFHIILAVILLNFNFSCSAPKPLTREEAATFDTGRDFLVVKIRDRYYELHNYRFLGECLEGDLLTKVRRYNNYILVSIDIEHKIVVKRKTPLPMKIRNENIKSIIHVDADRNGLAVLALTAGGFILLGFVVFVTTGGISYTGW